jgi:hypothetical protein
MFLNEGTEFGAGGLHGHFQELGLAALGVMGLEILVHVDGIISVEADGALEVRGCGW